MVSKEVVNAYAKIVPTANTYTVEAEEEYDHIEEIFSNKIKAIKAALDLMKYGYNVSINKKYFGGSARAESDYPVNQGYYGKKKKAAKITAPKRRK